MEVVHGDDPGVDATAIHNPVANSLVGDRDTYLPIESLQRQATALMVFGRRVGGPIGVLLEVAGHSIEEAVAGYVAEYGPFTNGPPPNYYGQSDHGEEVWHEPSE